MPGWEKQYKRSRSGLESDAIAQFQTIKLLDKSLGNTSLSDCLITEEDGSGLVLLVLIVCATGQQLLFQCGDAVVGSGQLSRQPLNLNFGRQSAFFPRTVSF